MDQLEIHFKHPTTIQVFGQTRSGKTRLVRRIRKKSTYSTVCYPCHLGVKCVATRLCMIRERYIGIEFEKWWRHEVFDSLSPKKRNILVLNDQMGVASSSTSVADLFTKGSHQTKLTCNIPGTKRV